MQNAFNKLFIFYGGEQMGILSNFSAYLYENGIKQSFVCERSGLLQPKLSRFMNKTDTACDVEDYIKLCKAVKKTPNYFLDIEDKIELGIELEPWEKQKLAEKENGNPEIVL